MASAISRTPRNLTNLYSGLHRSPGPRPPASNYVMKDSSLESHWNLSLTCSQAVFVFRPPLPEIFDLEYGIKVCSITRCPKLLPFLTCTSEHLLRPLLSASSLFHTSASPPFIQPHLISWVMANMSPSMAVILHLFTKVNHIK